MPYSLISALAFLFSSASAATVAPTYEHRYVQGRYCVDWTDSSIHALAWTADANGDSRPDIVDSIVEQIDQAWTILADSFQLTPPRLDTTAANCSLHVEIRDLKGTVSEGLKPIGEAVVSSGIGHMLLDNDLDPSGAVPTKSSTDVPAGKYKAVIFHETMHLFTRELATGGDATLVSAEQVAQWFANTRSGHPDLHIRSDTGNMSTGQLFDPNFRYSNWYWLEDIQSRYGTSAIVDWIKFRSAAVAKLPSEWNILREDSLLVAWFSGRGSGADQWIANFAPEAAKLFEGLASTTMPIASSSFTSTRIGLARPLSLETRGNPTRELRLPPLTWVAVVQPRDWSDFGGQTLTARVDAKDASGRIHASGLEYDSIQSSWSQSIFTLSGSDAVADTFAPGNAGSNRFLTFLTGSDSAMLQLSSSSPSSTCRLRPVSITGAKAGESGLIDDGDVSTWIEEDGEIVLDLGEAASIRGLDVYWREPLSNLSAFSVESSLDSSTWNPVDISIFNRFGSSWYTSVPSTSARWIRLSPYISTTTSDSIRLAEFAVWGSGSLCAEQASIRTGSARRDAKASLQPRLGGVVVVAPENGTLEWVSPDGRRLGTETRSAGTWRLESPSAKGILFAVWTSKSGRLVANVLPGGN